jgi:hypothetical protein
MVDDRLARPSDQTIFSENLESSQFDGQRIFHTLSCAPNQMPTNEEIRMFLKRSRTSLDYIVLLVNCSGSIFSKRHERLEFIDIKNIAGHTAVIVLGAYDGEGFLMFERSMDDDSIPI